MSNWSATSFVLLIVIGITACEQSTTESAPPHAMAPVQIELSGWQTYFQFNGVHEVRSISGDYTVNKVLEDPVLRTGYGLIVDGQLMVMDAANGDHFRLEGEVLLPDNKPSGDAYSFSSGDWAFTYTQSNGLFSACSELTKECNYINVEKGTFPFVYAQAEGAVLTITNWGDAVKFDGRSWCRMTVMDDVWACPTQHEPPVVEPRKQQFYSSVLYQGKTFLGHWPTGVLYHFDGKQLYPDQRMTPGPIWELRDQNLGYEAQSMSVYCGDLFVGYWPRGEVWRLDGQNSNWHALARLFSHGSKDSFIPYINREPDDLEGAFFGQRVTTLVPHADSLYAFTGNLNSWTRSVQNPSWLTEEQIREYGTIWRIHRPGCETKY